MYQVSKKKRAPNNNRLRPGQKAFGLLNLNKVSSLQVYPIRNEVELLRDKVDEAIKQNRTFMIFGNNEIVRSALVARGWIEKISVSSILTDERNEKLRTMHLLTIPELVNNLEKKEMAEMSKQVIYSKLLGVHPLALYWNLNFGSYKNNVNKFKNSLVNFIMKNRFNYANKQGLCGSVEQAHWFNNPGVSYLRVPRTYCLSNADDYDAFMNDFKMTAAISLIKWIVKTYEENTYRLMSPDGKISVESFHFALTECNKYMQKIKHEDIDKEIPDADELIWDQFLCDFHKLVHLEHHFQECTNETDFSLLKKSKTIIENMSKLNPNLTMDGFLNIWILKPSQGSRGVGIRFCKTIESVQRILKENNNYVIQKYIERPLLVHNTKFDIRQWFLISSTQPLTIWIWKVCYLRFSSQTYNLKNLHESIHLTNNSIQIKYRSDRRNPLLPDYSMWSLDQFKNYLEGINQPNVYEEIIYPGMRECITGAILANQDQIVRNPKAFELYGADFMVTEDFTPWLIEINSKPALNPSTPITTDLCPAVLEDVIKVVIDHAKSQKAFTGKFELLYKENATKLPVSNCRGLQVKGSGIVPGLLVNSKPESVTSTGWHSNESTAKTDYVEYVRSEMRRTLKSLNRPVF